MSVKLVILVVTFLIFACLAMFILIADMLDLDEYIPTYWNRFKNSLKHKSYLEKEIEEVQKDIDELEKHKEQVEKLEKLKRCKEDLLEQVEREDQ